MSYSYKCLWNLTSVLAVVFFALAFPRQVYAEINVMPATPTTMDEITIEVFIGSGFMLATPPYVISGNIIAITAEHLGWTGPFPPGFLYPIAIGKLPAGAYTVNYYEDDGSSLIVKETAVFTVMPAPTSVPTLTAFWLVAIVLMLGMVSFRKIRN